MPEYPLPSEDIEYLEANHCGKWRWVEETDKHGLIIENYRLPNGYNPEETALMVIIPPNYPGSMIDMFYFSPDISRKDGRAIMALTQENYFDRIWQRWSRHYSWRAGIDSIATHIPYVRNQLESELKK